MLVNDKIVQKRINRLNRAIILSSKDDLILLTALALIECEKRNCCDDLFKLKNIIKNKHSNQ